MIAQHDCPAVNNRRQLREPPPSSKKGKSKHTFPLPQASIRVVQVMTFGSIPALTISSRVSNALASCPALPQALMRVEYVTRFGCRPCARISCSQENASST